MASSPRPRGGWAAILLGIVFALIGLVLAAGGAWLAILGGSLYYLTVGIALVVAGVLLARRRLLGVWLYVAIFIGTLAWALWEVGLDGWGLVPRLVGPFVLLLLALLVLPPLGFGRWRGAFAGVAILLVVAVGFGYFVGRSSPVVAGPLPPMAMDMADPSP